MPEGESYLGYSRKLLKLRPGGLFPFRWLRNDNDWLHRDEVIQRLRRQVHHRPWVSNTAPWNARGNANRDLMYIG